MSMRVVVARLTHARGRGIRRHRTSPTASGIAVIRTTGLSQHTDGPSCSGWESRCPVKRRRRDQAVHLCLHVTPPSGIASDAPYTGHNWGPCSTSTGNLICPVLSQLELVNQYVRSSLPGNWKTTPQSRFSWSVRARSMELIGVLFCSPCNVVKLSVPSVYQ